ncbi:MAG: TIGR01777 family oxidoreductase [Legionellaceae bacterium]|nr:TIGR01777 family oxidoreductase [Legionellaceae bacterium]MBP9775041.1 TIGR01777 family oxidoreductase [Legionellaceae bacterium]
MNILIAGASGFIGKALVDALKQHNIITVLGRNETTLRQLFPINTTYCTWDTLSQLDAHNYDAVINLCGYNIAARRWTDIGKKQLIDSRVTTSEILTNWMMHHNAKPHFLCANAVGIYGLQENGDETTLDENTVIDTSNPKDFLSEIGIKWQAALQPAIDYGIPVTTTRFGVVLKKSDGMLKKLYPSFYLGLGSIIGDGAQMLSWIHIDDLVSAISFLLNKPELSGPFNVTSPQPVSQAQFARTLAKTMHRPLVFKIPAFLMRLLFGEMGECLLLKGQRVIPKRLLDAGFQFHYPTLEKALEHEFQ